MAEKVVAIVNPESGGGRTGKAWQEMRAKLSAAVGELRTEFTTGPQVATRLTRRALRAGATHIVAVGGDGTINEVVNGFFENDEPISRRARLSIMMSGTGCDFSRTLDLPEDITGMVHAAVHGPVRQLDIGRLTYVSDDGTPATRYFNNIASFGISGAIDRAVNKANFSKMFGGSFAFAFNTFMATMTYRVQPVRIQVDDTYDNIINIGTAAIANGQYFGGGMWIAPDASPFDGKFDIVILADTTKRDLITGLGDIYKGAHLKNPKTIVLNGKSIRARPVSQEQRVLLDIDGESPGRLPARFDILPGAIRFQG